MWIEGCEIHVKSERGGAEVEFVETFEPNIIAMIFRNEQGDKVHVRLDTTNAVNRAIENAAARRIIKATKED